MMTAVVRRRPGTGSTYELVRRRSIDLAKRRRRQLRRCRQLRRRRQLRRSQHHHRCNRCRCGQLRRRRLRRSRRDTSRIRNGIEPAGDLSGPEEQKEQAHCYLGKPVQKNTNLNEDLNHTKVEEKSARRYLEIPKKKVHEKVKPV